MKSHVHAAWLGVVVAASCAAGQSLVNGNFETGALSPWVVTPTAGGTSLATGVVTYDIDGPLGPQPASNAARFMVGNINPPLPPVGWEGVEITQALELGPGFVRFVVNWSVHPLVNVYNQSGGRFDIIADGSVLATAVAPPTTGLETSYGFLNGVVWVSPGGVYDVGVRITRPVLAGEEVFQYIDNFTISHCYPDCTGNGLLTIADYTCFQNEFISQTAYADCNNSGTWTVADFTCHLGSYVTGCP